MTTFQTLFEQQQNWARAETYRGVMEILHRHPPNRVQVGFSK